LNTYKLGRLVLATQAADAPQPAYRESPPPPRYNLTAAFSASGQVRGTTIRSIGSVPKNAELADTPMSAHAPSTLRSRSRLLTVSPISGSPSTEYPIDVSRHQAGRCRRCFLRTLPQPFVGVYAEKRQADLGPCFGPGSTSSLTNRRHWVAAAGSASEPEYPSAFSQ
jgi:hypothetical protein